MAGLKQVGQPQPIGPIGLDSHMRYLGWGIRNGMAVYWIQVEYVVVKVYMYYLWGIVHWCGHTVVDRKAHLFCV